MWEKVLNVEDHHNKADAYFFFIKENYAQGV